MFRFLQKNFPQTIYTSYSAVTTIKRGDHIYQIEELDVKVEYAEDAENSISTDDINAQAMGYGAIVGAVILAGGYAAVQFFDSSSEFDRTVDQYVSDAEKALRTKKIIPLSNIHPSAAPDEKTALGYLAKVEDLFRDNHGESVAVARNYLIEAQSYISDGDFSAAREALANLKAIDL